MRYICLNALKFENMIVKVSKCHVDALVKVFHKVYLVGRIVISRVLEIVNVFQGICVGQKHLNAMIWSFHFMLTPK